MENFFRSLRWIYWKLNRRFLEAFAITVIGQSQNPALNPDGPKIMDQLEAFLKTIPNNVYTQATLALMLMPLSVPETMPRSNILQLLVKIWVIIKSNIVRYRFPSRTPEEQRQIVDELFRRLANQSVEEEDDLIKSTVILTTVKQLLTSVYCELQSTWDALGYSPYPEPPRPWYPPSGPVIINPPRSPIGEYLHQEAKSVKQVARKEQGRTNYCIIGSGAGGAVAARRIQELDPQARIVILESGPLATNDQMPVRTMESTAKLYMNTGTTYSKNQIYIFRQGRCVGGSTTINNSIAWKPEGFWWTENIVKRWQETGANLIWDELHQAYDMIGPHIHAHPAEDRIITPMARTLKTGFEKVAPGLTINPVALNTLDCIGCGRCNVGCQYDAKQSMLVTYIPEVVKNGGYIVPDAHVDELIYSQTSHGRVVTRVKVVTADGETIEVEADKFVLAAGGYASTKLLWKSGFTGVAPGVRTVGKQFTGNFGTPLLGRFPQPMGGSTGQQVGYVVEIQQERLVIETFFGPPIVLFGIIPRQWGREYMRMVESYNNMAIANVVWSALSYGQIDRGVLPTVGWALDYRLGGFVIDFSMGAEDWRRMSRGLNLSARAMFEMGAEEIYSTRFDAKILRPNDDIDAYFADLGPANYMDVETAHLQGGNIINRDPEMGVVDENFKVYGFDNLWIADASVIPSAITVNLQFTVMALAYYAARRIAEA